MPMTLFGKMNFIFKSWNTDLSSSEEIFTSSFHIRRTVQNRNKNLDIYGYGLKGMLLCMIETICKVTNGEGDLNLVKEILRSGQELLQRPIILLDGVQEVISALCENYKLVLATKGDLFDQKERFLRPDYKNVFAT